MTHHVFISYATPDRALAERVCAELESNSIGCWIAPRDVPAGADYAKTITEAIASSKVLLLLLSASAAASEHIEREVHLAVSAKASIVPLRLEAVEPTGSLKYLLANVQYLDGFPRLEPQLAPLRSEIRRALLDRGTVVARTERSRFEQVLATAGAWAIVIGVEVLLVEWMRRMWFNLTPPWRVPIEALQSLTFLPLLAAPPIIALATQYWMHRTLGRIFTLDALFAIFGSIGARARLGVAAALCAGLIAAIVMAPPTIQVRLVDGKIDGKSDAGDTHVQARTCLPSESYVSQSAGHYIVELRVGSGNPEGSYALRAELAPYATADGIEFCEIWLDREFGVTALPIMSDDQRSAGYIEVGGPVERFAGTRSVLFNVRHYRDSEPSDQSAVAATVSHESVQSHDDEPVALPLR